MEGVHRMKGIGVAILTCVLFSVCIGAMMSQTASAIDLDGTGSADIPSSIGPPFFLDAVMLYEDTGEWNSWRPLPTRGGLMDGSEEPVTFPNGTVLEVHGKLFERSLSPDTSYLDDIGFADVPVRVEFDGEVVKMHNITGNTTTVIQPFMDNGNGTFQFLLEISKPAGEYELVLSADPWYPAIPRLVYTTVVYVNHPTTIDMTVPSARLYPGDEVVIEGSITDDTGGPVPDVPLKIWGEDGILEPEGRGVYVDDVVVSRSPYTYDFDNGTAGWLAHTLSEQGVQNQWELGFPLPEYRPPPHSGDKCWGTIIDGPYQRGAWSILVSPPLNLSDGMSHRVTFYAWWDLDRSDDTGYLVVSTDGGISWHEDRAHFFTRGRLRSELWDLFSYDLTPYGSHPALRIAFVFRSSSNSTQTGPDGTFSYRHVVPEDAEVGFYDYLVVFEGDLLFRGSEAEAGIIVRLTTRILIDVDEANRTGYRNHPMLFKGRLLDQRGQAPVREIDGHKYYYYVHGPRNWDGWTIDDGWFGSGYPVDGDTGEFAFTYVISPDQPLGPVNVTIRFPGDDFYTGFQVSVVYRVKAHVYIMPPHEEERTVFRGQHLDIEAELRVVPGESLGDDELGDLVTDQFIHIWWGDAQIANRRVDFHLYGHAEFLVPSTHELGHVPVRFVYDGADIYEPMSLEVRYTVGSETFITLEDKEVRKGEYATIDGVVRDDRGEPVPHVRIAIIWKRAPEIGRVLTNGDGSFFLRYYIEHEDRVGNVTVIARFLGTDVHIANQTRATYNVKARTILERRDRSFNLLLDHHVRISGRLYEDWGGYRGREVQREVVSLVIDGEVVASRRTAFDGSFTFEYVLDEELFEPGEVRLALVFNGTEHLVASTNSTTVFIRAHYLLTTGVEVNGRPFDPFADVVRPRDTVRGWMVVRNEDGLPWSGVEVSVYYSRDDGRGTDRLIHSGTTNSSGNLEFHHLLTDEEGGQVIFKMSLPGLVNQVEITLDYIVPPAPSSDEILRTLGDTSVAVNIELDLRVDVIKEQGWDMDRMTYSLVNPPDGMEIDENGNIGWSPVEGQEGTHLVTVWLYDGERSETALIVVTVSEAAGPPDGLHMLVLAAALLSIVLLALSLYTDARRRRGGKG